MCFPDCRGPQISTDLGLLYSPIPRGITQFITTACLTSNRPGGLNNPISKKFSVCNITVEISSYDEP